VRAARLRVAEDELLETPVALLAPILEQRHARIVARVFFSAAS